MISGASCSRISAPTRVGKSSFSRSPHRVRRSFPGTRATLGREESTSTAGRADAEWIAWPHTCGTSPRPTDGAASTGARTRRYVATASAPGCWPASSNVKRRGVLHVHPVLGFKTPAERHAAHLYAKYLFGLAPRYGFGFTERKLQTRSAKRVAAYLSSYFVTGKKDKLSLQESVMAPDMPRSIVHVSTELTQHTGVTMRELRFRRFVWFLADRLCCPLAEARLIATQATAGTLDLTVDVFLPSPARITQVLGRRPPPNQRLLVASRDPASALAHHSLPPVRERLSSITANRSARPSTITKSGTARETSSHRM